MSRITIDSSVIKMMRNIGLISTVTINKDFIKFKENETFKDKLTEYLSDCIKALKELTLEHNIEYVEVEEVDSKLDINLCLHRLYYFVSEIIDILILGGETQQKSVQKAVSGVVYYIKVICLIYNIKVDNIVIDKKEYNNESIA